MSTTLRRCPYLVTAHCVRHLQERRKLCPGCKGRLVERVVDFGVFVWRGDGRYRREDALWVYGRELDALKRATREDDLVVRELPVEVENGENGPKMASGGQK